MHRHYAVAAGARALVALHHVTCTIAKGSVILLGVDTGPRSGSFCYQQLLAIPMKVKVKKKKEKD
jgi:hypothetical protein